MKIIRDGDTLLGRFVSVLNYTFSCDACDCVFTVERDDFENGTAKVGPYLLQDYGALKTTCPQCNGEVSTNFYAPAGRYSEVEQTEQTDE